MAIVIQFTKHLRSDEIILCLNVYTYREIVGECRVRQRMCSVYYNVNVVIIFSEKVLFNRKEWKQQGRWKRIHFYLQENILKKNNFCRHSQRILKEEK